MKRTQNHPVESLRARQKAETYRIILEVASDMFESLGYEKTTMRKIAVDSGLSPGAIFKHFENKSALLAAKLHGDIEKVQNKAIQSIPRKSTVNKQFIHIAESFFKYYEKRPILSKMLVQHSLFIGGKWAEKFESQAKRLIRHLADSIQEGKNRNEIRQDVDGVTLAAVLWANYIFILILTANAQEMSASAAIAMLKPMVKQTFAGAIIRK
jgi:AcrR family transcriptional regulator